MKYYKARPLALNCQLLLQLKANSCVGEKHFSGYFLTQLRHSGNWRGKSPFWETLVHVFQARYEYERMAEAALNSDAPARPALLALSGLLPDVS